MKNLLTFRGRTLVSLVALILAFPMFNSCFDDSELWAEIENINSRLDSLENDLNAQIVAFNKLVTGGKITISECEMRADSSYLVTLSDGTSFSVLPDSKDMKSMVSFLEVGGIKYWAVYGADGKLTLLTDPDGNYVPMNVVPMVEERDGDFYLVIGNQEYKTGFDIEDKVSLFTDCTMHKDESGNVYSITFVLAGGEYEFTFPVDGYKGFRFLLGSSVSTTVIKDYFVNYGSTVRILVDTEGVVDYVMQIPDGWRVKEEVNELMKETHLNITAPSKDAVDSGVAADGGDLKVIAVVEGGKSMVARLELSTTPYKRITTTSTNAIIQKYNGVDKFLYGLLKKEDFDIDEIFAGADAVLKANSEGLSDSDINLPLSEIYGSELSEEERYVLWTIPAFYSMSGEESGYYVIDGLYKVVEFGPIKVNLKAEKVVFNNMTLSFSMRGATEYYGGTLVLTDDWKSEVLNKINNVAETKKYDYEPYEGSSFKFADVLDLVPVSKESYVTWVVPAQEGKTEYIEDDIVFVEYTLPDVTSGGSLAVTAGTPVTDRVSITVPLASVGAQRIYYAFVSTGFAKKTTTDEKRQAYLLEKNNFVNAAELDAREERLDPSTSRVLFTMAVDEDGRYGSVLAVSDGLTTKGLVFNDVSVKIEEGEVGQKRASFPVTVVGDYTDYILWVGKTGDSFWTSSDYCNKSESRAEQYMALYPDDQELVKSKSQHTYADGKLTLTGLAGDREYVALLMLKDDTGEYSHAGIRYFTTAKADLGTIVKSTDQAWKDAKAAVKITWHEDKFRKAENSQLSAFYAFDFSCPTDLTAYVYCITDEYFNENPDFKSVEDIIVGIEADCSRRYDADAVVRNKAGEYITEPDWVDDSGETHEGTLMNVYNFYVHGYPTNGFATYFAAGTHGENNCTAWETSCENYDHALESIRKRVDPTYAYYKDYVRRTRGCKLDANVDEIAMDLYYAYLPYYEKAEPLIFVNNGGALYMEQHYASGYNQDKGEVMDDVYVVFKDKNGNYYEPMSFEVPNKFK